MAETAKEIWEILIKTYGDSDKHKRVKLQALRRSFEFLIMEDNESVASYFNKVQSVVNAMKSCNETLSQEHVVNKILRSLHPKFDHLVITIEETKDIDKLSIQELQHSLEGHELRMSDHKSYQELVLQARTSSKPKKDTKKGTNPRKRLIQSRKMVNRSKAGMGVKTRCLTKSE